MSDKGNKFIKGAAILGIAGVVIKLLGAVFRIPLTNWKMCIRDRVKVEDGAYIAAGSTVTEDVPEDALCIARARQKNIRGWAAEKGLYRK